MEETAIRDPHRLAELEKLIEETGTEYWDNWNYIVSLIDYEENTHEETKVSMFLDENLIREYAKLLLADHDYRYVGVEISLGDNLIYKDFRYD